MSILQTTTLVTAIIGAVTGIMSLRLGIMNHRYQLNQAKIRLRVVPKLAFPGPMDEMVTETYFSEHVESALRHLKAYLCVEVTNLSPIEQVIFEIGLVAPNGSNQPWREPDWLESEEHTFPVTLKPGETAAAFLRIDPDDCRSLSPIGYARTDCGDQFEGSSPIVDDFIKSVKSETLCN